jgi:RNA polymerase sigma-70 factor (ECF subfamily)
MLAGRQEGWGVARPCRLAEWKGMAVARAARLEARRGDLAMLPLLPYDRAVTNARHPVTSLEEEFVRLRPRLERYLRSRGAGHVTEDLVQELWFKAASLPAGTEVHDPSSYLFRIAHNLMLDKRRHELRRVARDQNYLAVAQSAGMDVDPAPSAERIVEGRRRLERVDAVLKALGERTDYVFRRHRVEGIPQRDIATELGISLSAVEKHLQKAYKAVQAAYREGGEHDLA